MTSTHSAAHPAVVDRLSLLDRLLPLWIGMAMAAGLLVGRFVPGLNADLNHVQVDGISLPIALGLLVMMYPVLAKVRYDRLDSVTGDRRLLLSSLLLNWVIGPALMFALAWLLLPDLPEYRTGLIIVGLARCIAMVIIWNDLACGDREAAAVLVALNSVFQVVMFAVLGWFYLAVLPGWLGLPQTAISTSPWQIANSVLIFLGIPLLAGYFSRRFGEKAKGRGWYESTFLPRVGPWALYGLLFTIVILFALQGDQIISRPVDVVRIALPLLGYFAIMWGGGYIVGALLGLGYQRTTTLAFTAAGNNFELAIAVAIATFGATSGQALAGVVGPLIEVPVLVALVYVSLALRHRFRRDRPIVLFLCIHNAGRSQMAMAFFKHLAAGRASVYSGGSEPADEINPAAVAVMAEVGIDMTCERPKRWTDDIVQAADVVVTMGCGDACPYIPGKRYENWELADPAGLGLDEVRSIRDAIELRVHHLLDQLGISPVAQ
ncbi:MAG: ACR3 family arsenite efflux transporter [Mycobacterium sp.]|uniref:ACR3 family arsenite efflux transporter n=1 Tax=Mycobacterium sp. TaxID=1785 RepID=UPI001EC6FBB1|nr:ACR3 family arsenite efflux transporter [Mycobacterium sp.]MBV8789346.1 ACR3 family arsenite efflux transporter [Mycobacterium sp.]